MRTCGAAFVTAFLAGCSGPLPRPIHEIEAADRRFAPPSPPPAARPSPAEEILKKEAFTVDDAVAVADAMNPELAAARKDVDLAGAAILDAGLYPNPSLLLNAEDYRTKDGSTIGRMQRSAGVSVPLVVGGRIGAATRLAEKEREVATANYVWRRREILSNVRRAFAETLAARRTAELARESRDLARQLRDVTDQRFQAQAVPETEPLKAAVSFAKAEIDLKLAEKDAVNAIKSLHALMGNVDLPTEKLAGDLAAKFAVPDLEALRGQVAAGHPLLAAAAKEREAAELQLAHARAEAVRDIDFEIVAGRDPEDDAIVEGGFRIPIPLFDRNQGKIMAAEIRIRQAGLEIQAVKTDLIRRLAEAHRDVTTAQDRVGVYQAEILPKAEKAMAQTNEGYRLGKFGQLEVLDAQRTLAEARIAYATALAELQFAAVELEKLTGIRMEPVHEDRLK